MMTKARIAGCGGFLAAALLLSGCSSISGQPQLLTATPRGGGSLEKDPFSVVTGVGEPRADRVTYGFLPSFSRKRAVLIDEQAETLTNSDYSMITLGLPYQYLPFQFSFSRYVYEKGNPEPVGTLERRYNPFWSSVSTEGNIGDDFEIDVKGVPILAEWGYERGPSWYFEDFAFRYDPTDQREFRFFAALWWLGPTYYDVTGSYFDKDGTKVEYDGEYVTPLLLGRALGFLLWSSYRAGEAKNEREVRTAGHGPLLGYPGYFSKQVTEGDGRRAGLRLLLGGSLWYEGSSTEATTGETNSAKGPLWGLFGVGRRADAPVVYFLRYPIRIGSAETSVSLNQDTPGSRG